MPKPVRALTEHQSAGADELLTRHDTDERDLTRHIRTALAN
jgi:hypothetical protein